MRYQRYTGNRIRRSQLILLIDVIMILCAILIGVDDAPTTSVGAHSTALLQGWYLTMI